MTLIENLKKQWEQLVNPALEVSTAGTAGLISISADDVPPPPPVIERKATQQVLESLEAIYTIESIDVSTVRPLVVAQPAPKEQKKRPKEKKKKIEQLEFNFGIDFQTGMDSFTLLEPLYVLDLSVQLEKCLKNHSKFTIGDLLKQPIEELAQLKGMGQAHFEEIKQKLDNYLDGKTLKRAPKVDFIAWLRSITAHIDRKKAYIALASFQLADHFSLLPSESIEVRRLTEEKRQEWLNEAFEALRTPELNDLIHDQMQQVFAVFIKPWLLERHGFGAHFEILERLQRISENENDALTVLHFFQQVYFRHAHPFSVFLSELEPGVYAADNFVKDDYLKVIHTTKSYFYQDDIAYTSPQLLEWLKREWARDWRSFSEPFIEKALRFSPQFRVRRNGATHLTVKLA